MKIIICEVKKQPYMKEVEEVEALHILLNGRVITLPDEDDYVIVCNANNTQTKANNRLNIFGDFYIIGFKYGRVFSLDDNYFEYLMKNILNENISE